MCVYEVCYNFFGGHPPERDLHLLVCFSWPKKGKKMCGVFFCLTNITPPEQHSVQSLNKVCAGVWSWSPPLVFCVPLGSTAQTGRFSLPKHKQNYLWGNKKMCEERRAFHVQSHYNLTAPTSLSYGFLAIAVLLCLFACSYCPHGQRRKHLKCHPEWRASKTESGTERIFV